LVIEKMRNSASFVVDSVMSDRLEVHDLAMAGNHRDEARMPAFVHGALGELGYLLQSFTGEADIFGIRHR
jgi:hypothetical protein